MLDFVRSLFGMDRTRAIIIGLAALWRLQGRARAAPFAPSMELRAVLALLYLHSDGDRTSFDQYWHTATENGLDYASDLIAAVCRRNGMMAAWHGIARSLGTEATIDLMAAIHRVPGGDRPTGEPAAPR